MALTGKQRRYLRGLGHALDPVVQVGKEGVTHALVEQVRQQLEIHELIKVKLAQSVEEGRHSVAGALAEATRSELAQVLGRTLLLYRPRAEDPVIQLPR
jgi:RNA-binding protein